LPPPPLELPHAAIIVAEHSTAASAITGLDIFTVSLLTVTCV
jgi:hypothetical protein